MPEPVSRFLRHLARLLGLGLAVALAVVVGLLIYNEVLGSHFSGVIPMRTEAYLFDKVGEPTTTWACDEGLHPLPSERCARIHYYRTFLVRDGWVVPIAHDGEILAVRRLNLPY